MPDDQLKRELEALAARLERVERWLGMEHPPAAATSTPAAAQSGAPLVSPPIHKELIAGLAGGESHPRSELSPAAPAPPMPEPKAGAVPEAVPGAMAAAVKTASGQHHPIAPPSEEIIVLTDATPARSSASEAIDQEKKDVFRRLHAQPDSAEAVPSQKSAASIPLAPPIAPRPSPPILSPRKSAPPSTPPIQILSRSSTSTTTPLELLIGGKWMAWVGAIVVVLAAGFAIKVGIDRG